jgi:hypothetical protein
MRSSAFSCILGLFVSTGLARSQSRIDFTRDIEPIFKARCYACHGPQVQMNGLRLDVRDRAMAGGYSGAVIRPGASSKSRLIQMVTGQIQGKIMPPSGPSLTLEETSKLRAWIDHDAVWPQVAEAASSNRKANHWSLQRVARPVVPSVRDSPWVRNPADAFVLAKLESEHIQPSPEADKTTLIRRVSIDLTGLPPTAAEVSEFLADPSPDAYEALVDRLMKSPHYGEKWARHWLDVARYGDSDGYEKDSRRPYAWRYRDWVVQALNQDMPFDLFTIEQIAGDLLPNATIEQKVATGFQRNTLTNREGGVNIEQFRFEQVVDRTNAVGTAWLGLTIGCAQCHDHKYDPISQQEYYQLFAFFNTADEVNIEAPLPGERGPYLAGVTAYYSKRRKLLEEYRVTKLQSEWEHRLIEAAESPGKWTDWDVAFDTVQKMVDNGERILRTPAERRTRREEDAIEDHMVEWYHQVVGILKYKEMKWKELQNKLYELRSSFPDLTQAPTIAESPQHRKTFVYLRGDYRQRGIELQPATPAVLPALIDSAEPARLRLARWLVSPENPLTPRVIVNRIWQELFGQGIVTTSEDLGSQGAKPSHRELLDWLAADFMDQGWSMKQVQRLIVTSATYRQSSKARPELQSRDPYNTLLARQTAFRLPAELIRDSALAASGLLNPEIGGKSIRPYQPESVTKLAFGNNDWVKWEESTGKDRYRRGLYIFFQRTAPYPLLANFDAPDSTTPACRRRRSDTPLQALNLLNDPVFLEAAQGLAERILQECPGGLQKRLSYAYRLTLARQPDASESERLLGYLEAQKSILHKDPKSAELLFPVGMAATDRTEAAAWVALSRVLLNLDEFLTRE